MSEKFRPLVHYLREVAGLSFDHFLQTYNHPFLLWAQNLDWAEKIDPQFETAEVEYGSEQPASLPAETESQVAGTLVIEVRKRTSSGPANTVYVGRAANNDIIFSHKSVSKLQAYFLQTGTGHSYELADADSTNGTRLNNIRLSSYRNQPLSNQDRIEFGPSIQVMYLTSRGFYDFLLQLIRSGIT
jgi:pSer/pThr/pTyr-binding forkhead associated (FHA) protein